MPKHLRFAAAVLCLACACLSAFSADAGKIISVQPVHGEQWRPPGRQISYIQSHTKQGFTYDVLSAYDLDTGASSVLFDPTAKGDPGANPTSLNGATWSPDGSALLVQHAADLWYVSILTGTAKRLITKDADIELTTFSPDGKHVAFVKKNDLYTVDTATGAVSQITTDGSESVLNGKLDWVYGEEFEEACVSGRAYKWSPDGRYIAFLRLDQSAVPEIPIVDFLQTHPTLKKQRYPKAGDPNSSIAVCVADLAAARLPRLNRRAPLKNAEYILPELTWTPDSKTLAVMTLNRAQNDLMLWAWSPATDAEPRLVLEEKDAAWINVYDGPHFLKAPPAAAPGPEPSAFGFSFVWLSERDGWLHAYLYGADGKLSRQLTRGPWMIAPGSLRSGHSSPVQIDPAGERLYFSSTQQDPRERQLCRVRIDGTSTEPEALSREPGWHVQQLAPDGKSLLESFSSVDQPHQTRLLQSDGRPLALLQPSPAAVKNAAAEFHTLTAADGAKLYGRMILPPNFNAATKYPVIVNVYGGPSIQLIRNAWGVDDWLDKSLATEGFIIWKMDNRGSAGRGHAWETAIYKNMGARELADQKAGLDYLKKLPYVDASRIGVHGWSYGGYMTLYMLTHAPDMFKCGAAGAPVTDWKFYDTIYTERYMSTPAENPKGYLSSSPLAAAGNLTAKLLLIHGTSDDNVHVQNTMNFLDALTKKGRPYELQIQPGQKHGFRGERAWLYLTERTIDFFKRNL